MEERIIRTVTEIGNGAHIFAPKEWLYDEVVITRVPKKNPKEELIKLLSPYLNKIIAVFLYGSYARGEQTPKSDMDIFVISTEKFNIKSKDIEIMVVPEEKLETAKKINPILFYSILQEAKPIINPPYLEKLRKEEIKPAYFNDFLDDTKRLIQINKEMIKLDKMDKDKDSSESTIYSLVLRLRGIFIINLFLKKKIYSNGIFRTFLIKNSKIDYEKIYNIYRSIRDNKKTEEKVKIEEAESLLTLLIKETQKLEKKLK